MTWFCSHFSRTRIQAVGTVQILPSLPFTSSCGVPAVFTTGAAAGTLLRTINTRFAKDSIIMTIGRDLLHAASFAADKHRDQRRKNVEASPYINHPIQVAELIARVGQVEDRSVLMAAVLHDTVEDTETTFDELERVFGSDVRDLVAEVTDDKSLSKAERKKEQIKHTATMTDRAKLIKLADKSCNVRDVAQSPPEDWDMNRRKEYLHWASEVIAGCRGTNPRLERYFDETIQRAGEVLGLSDSEVKPIQSDEYPKDVFK